MSKRERLIALFLKLYHWLYRWSPRIRGEMRRGFYYLTQATFAPLSTYYPMPHHGRVGYLGSKDRDYDLFKIGEEVRPGFRINLNEDIRLDLNLGKEKKYRFTASIGIVKFLPPQLQNSKVIVSTKIFSGAGREVYSGKLEMPLDGMNSYFTHLYGKGWLSWYVDLDDMADNERAASYVVIRAELPAGRTPQANDAIDQDSFVLGMLQCLPVRERPKKIIMISLESLTDPKIMSQIYPEFKNGLDTYALEFMKKYNARSNVYCQGDTTAPSCQSQFTGLTASQHGLGNYSPGPNSPNIPVRNESCLGIAEILKKQGYFTYAAALTIHNAAHYGSARGFDWYINVDQIGDPKHLEINTCLIPALENTPGIDGYYYMHIDAPLHLPYNNARTAPFSPMENLKDIHEPRGEIRLYVKNLNQLFRQLKNLDDYIEQTKDRVDYLVMITGDHGNGLTTHWGANKDFAIYDERIRVPLMIRGFSENAPVHNADLELPTNAAIEMFRAAIHFAGSSIPEKIRDLPQYDPKFSGLSICETILHPQDEDYCLVIADAKFKYALRLSMDYDSGAVKNMHWERLFRIEAGMANEKNDVLGLESETAARMRALAQEYVARSFAFNRAFPQMSSLDPSLPWTTRDPRSPSFKNRRKKKIVREEGAKL